MKIKVYFFGKQKEITDWEKEYIRRINFRCDFELIALNQSGLKESLVAKQKEGDLFLSKISDQDFVVALDEKGSEKDSTLFSRWIKKRLENYGTVHFVIGGAHGLDPRVLNRVNEKVCFGRMVWTRNLVRLMACEQIYRALEIDGGGNFHKA
jgi:23S rRNA (pseudouridine1915-N3)-methyltransferase